MIAVVLAAVTSTAAVLLVALLAGLPRALRARPVRERPQSAARPARTSGPRRGYLGWLARRHVLAGRPALWTPRNVLVGKPLLTAAFGLPALLWLAADPVPLRIAVALFAVTLAFWTPDLLLHSRGVERQQRVGAELPDTLDQMTIAVEAGLGFEAAMAKAAANGSGPLAAELTRTLQDLSIGRSRQDAYGALAERAPSPDLRRFVRAVIQADVYGIAIGDVLRVQASEMRLKRRQRAEEQAMKVPVKVLFPLMFCILPVLFIIILAPGLITAMHTLL
ncbi:type II secretion system F family protein [Amnibacterium endophyticum]|uniref:Type II secretion system F family protein n=1 Tax=Amnibacterium endophyticum TaxID=2109337 RepID=A0ABW4LCS9_9MICO